MSLGRVMAGQTDPLVGMAEAELRGIPPFDRLSEADLRMVVMATEVRYLSRGEEIFAEGAEPSGCFFILKKGRVEIERSVDGERHLIDVCDDGDVFGIRALIVGQPYSARAVASEESLLFSVEYPVFAKIMERVPEVSLFFAAGFAAELPPLRERIVQAAKDVRKAWSKGSARGSELHVVRPSRAPVTSTADATVQSVARRMRDDRIGSMLVVDQEGKPIGMVTDTDLRNRVVAEGLDVSTPVEVIMSSPVSTIRPEPTVDELTEQILRRGCRHFVITEDGSADAAALGVVSEHDVLVAKRSTPSVIIDGLRGAKDRDELRRFRDLGEELLAQYLQEEVGMKLVCAVLSQINDAMVQTAIQWAEAELEAKGRRAPCPWCWLGLGSDGREEQLLRTDQDNAILYAEDGEEHQDYFLQLGAHVVESLVAAGFARCPGDIMASNPRWVQSVSGWKKNFQGWIERPEPVALMHANIFFDFRAVAGEGDLAAALRAWLVECCHQIRGFFSFFAHSAQANPPPLSFFRSVVVERSGEHKDRFDIKARAMMPLCDAARVLVHDFRLAGQVNTVARFRAVSREEGGPLGRLCDEAADAYEMFIRFRVEEGLRCRTSGRFIEVDRLSKLERQSLRNAFRITEDLQLSLRQRYRTDFLR
jgi:CBS domain-containing protein